MKGEWRTNKEELSLELTKLISEKLITTNKFTENAGNLPKAIVEAYNFIYDNIKAHSEQ